MANTPSPPAQPAPAASVEPASVEPASAKTDATRADVSAEAAFQLALADPTERDLLAAEDRARLSQSLRGLGRALRQAVVAVAVTLPLAALAVIAAVLRMAVSATVLRKARGVVAKTARPEPATEAEHSALAVEHLLTSCIPAAVPVIRRALMRAMGASRSPYCGALTLKIAARSTGGVADPTAGGLKRPKTHVVVGITDDPDREPSLSWRLRRFEFSGTPQSDAEDSSATVPEGWREITGQGETSLLGVEAALTAFFTDAGASDHLTTG